MVIFRSASFRRAHLKGNILFSNTQFLGNTSFEGAEFAGDGRFGGAFFGQRVEFQRTRFRRDVLFDEARFNADAASEGMSAEREVVFNGASFKSPIHLGPLQANARLVLDRATFEEAAQIDAAAPQLCCISANFRGPATLRVRWAEMVFDGTGFSQPSTLAFAQEAFRPTSTERTHRRSTRERALLDEHQFQQRGRQPRPRLVSLRGVDVSSVVLSGLDLGPCLFSGAHHLDQLQIQGSGPFANTPGGIRFGRVGLRFAVWRWTRRQVLAEECRWRASEEAAGGSRLKRAGWNQPRSQTPSWLAERTGQGVEPLQPERLVVLYRALRKAQEDSKDEPGAADFYYGELAPGYRPPRMP